MADADNPDPSWTTGLGDRYELLRRLHQRPGSDTYRAHDQLLERSVTVVVHRGDGSRAADPGAGDCPWARPIEALRRLDHHHVAERHDGGAAGEGSADALAAIAHRARRWWRRPGLDRRGRSRGPAQ